MLKKILIIIVIIFTYGAVFPTPTPAIWEREILLGVNDTCYFLFHLKRYYTGTHYHYVDTLFLEEKDLKEGKVRESIVLRIINHKDSTTFNNWTHIDYVKKPINTIQLLIDKKVHFVFPNDLSYSNNIEININGLFLKDNQHKELIVTYKHITKYINWLKKSSTWNKYYKNSTYNFNYIGISATYESENHIFFVVEYGLIHCIDSNLFQSILAINKEDYLKAKKELNKHKK